MSAVVERHRWHLIAALAVVATCAAPAARADEIVAKNSTLHGSITGITAKGAEIETEFAKARVSVPFTDMRDITTDGAFRVFHGEDQEATGRLLGIRDGKLMVGQSLADAQAIDTTSIVSGRSEGGWSFAAVRSQMRYWSGTVDLGFGLTQATVDNTTLSAGVQVERNKSPTRLVFTLGGHYGTQKQERPEPAGPETRLADDLRGGIRGQYDLTPAIYLWASGDGKYDGIQKISYRVVPAGGLGYYLYKTETASLQVESGGSYV